MIFSCLLFKTMSWEPVTILSRKIPSTEKNHSYPFRLKNWNTNIFLLVTTPNILGNSLSPKVPNNFKFPLLKDITMFTCTLKYFATYLTAITRHTYTQIQLFWIIKPSKRVLGSGSVHVSLSEPECHHAKTIYE